ncbi:MAG TPA: sugar phosphate isomerase/epimerase [Desulfobacterales bacterium]|nr:sugar phosphate isomerase/epimerase [Desulfobacterales bacterium]
MRNPQKPVRPKVAMCNIFSEVDKLRQFALDCGFFGIDWSFDVRTFPDTPAEESKWVKDLAALKPLEIRYHCPFYRIDLGHHDPWEAKAAEAIFRRIIHLVSKAQGEYLTIHIGLGHDSTERLAWEASVENLARVVQYGGTRNVKVCLENLAWGWTSRPNLFEKLIRGSGAAVTFDIGHAHACESVRSHHYAFEDFVTPHSERVFNAHIYHTEVSGLGHIPPDGLEDIQDRLAILQNIGCEWWVAEIREPNGLVKTKGVIDEYLTGYAPDSKTDVKAASQV